MKTRKDKEAEKDRQVSLNKQFKIDAARWTVVQKKTKIANLKQKNPVREAELKDLIMKEVVIRTDNNDIKLATEQKLAEIKRLKELNARISSSLNLKLNKTGNGN